MKNKVGLFIWIAASVCVAAVNFLVVVLDRGSDVVFPLAVVWIFLVVAAFARDGKAALWALVGLPFALYPPFLEVALALACSGPPRLYLSGSPCDSQQANGTQ